MTPRSGRSRARKYVVPKGFAPTAGAPFGRALDIGGSRGKRRYGLAAVIALVHDVLVALGAVALSKWFMPPGYKIDLPMVAAFLTLIGFSVNDTIVIFDRVRELRGKSNAPLSAKLVNDAINQCFGRTIWTTFTVFIVVLIMYIWGGAGVRGFSFAMLIGACAVLGAAVWLQVQREQAQARDPLTTIDLAAVRALRVDCRGCTPRRFERVDGHWQMREPRDVRAER